MKIVFIGCRGIHILGGIESYMYNLTQELNKLGHECIVWCESDHHEVEVINGVKVIYQPGPKSAFLCKPWCGLKATLKTLFKEKNVSFIHYNAWGPSLLACWIPRLFGVQSLMEGHGLEWQRSKYSSKKQKIMRMMEKITAKMNQNLIMCSEAQVRYFKKEYGLDSTCMPCAVTLPKEDYNNPSNVLERFGLEEGKYFLFLARLVQDKNPDFLIKAFKEAKRDGYKLVIAGSNDAMPDYVDKLHELGADCEDVVFTGAMYADDKDMLLRKAFCYCIPSTIEGLAIGLLEAMSYKLPVIASDIEANQEALDEDEAVWCKAEDVDSLKSAIEKCVENPNLLEAFKERTFEKIKQKYTWDKVAMKYVDYLHSLGIN